MSDTTLPDVGIDSTTPIISVRPVTLATPDRGHDLRVRVSAPTTGHDLPVVVFSHGMTMSMDSLRPAGRLLDRSRVRRHPAHPSRLAGPRSRRPAQPPLIWRIRTDDLTCILDRLDAVEAAVPGLAGRIDHGRIAAAGHSWGAQTASTLAGARAVNADGRPV